MPPGNPGSISGAEYARIVAWVLQQNGFAAGQLQSVAVDSENRVVGTFTNGQTIPLAQITLATFNGEDSLQALNGGAYAATAQSTRQFVELRTHP